MNEIEIINTVAKAKMPPGWEPYYYNGHNVVGGIIVTGDVPLGRYTRGRSKGRFKFPAMKHGTSCFVSNEECEAEKRNRKEAN